jgi:hypothetical protein
MWRPGEGYQRSLRVPYPTVPCLIVTRLRVPHLRVPFLRVRCLLKSFFRVSLRRRITMKKSHKVKMVSQIIKIIQKTIVDMKI